MVKDCTFTDWKESYVSDSSSEKSHYESNELESIPVTQISANQINRSDQMQQNAIQYMQQIRKTPSIQSAFGSNKTRNQIKCMILYDIWGMVTRIKELKFNFKTPMGINWSVLMDK